MAELESMSSTDVLVVLSVYLRLPGLSESGMVQLGAVARPPLKRMVQSAA